MKYSSERATFSNSMATSIKGSRPWMVKTSSATCFTIFARGSKFLYTLRGQLRISAHAETLHKQFSGPKKKQGKINIMQYSLQYSAHCTLGFASDVQHRRRAHALDQIKLSR